MSGDGLFAKDCQCQSHDGPHWLHMQLMDRAKLMAAVVENPTPSDAFAHWAFSEAARLEGELAKEMERRGIDVLPARVVRLVRESHERWVHSRKRTQRAAA